MPRFSELLRKPDWVDESKPTTSLQELQQQSRVNGDLPNSGNIVSRVPVRCPMPTVGTPNADSLRQFYNSTAPKTRLFPI